MRLQVVDKVLIPAAVMLLAAGASLSALDAAAQTLLLSAVIFTAPLLLPSKQKPSAAPSPSRQQRTELNCSVDFRTGSVLMGAIGGATASMRASVATAATSSPVHQPPAARCALAESGQHHHLGLLETVVRSRLTDSASVLASIMSTCGKGSGDCVSALPDEALHPTQLDAALHLAAVDASAARRGLRVPAAAGCFFLHSPAAKQGKLQQQAVSTAPVASLARSEHRQEAWSMSDHQLDVGSACCALSGLLAKPLKADLSTAGPLSTTPNQHAADMLYGVEWQALALCSSAEHPPDTPAISAHAPPVALRMRASQGPARMAAAGVHLAAVHAAASPQRAAALTAAPGLGVRPAHHHSATAAVQSGILAGIMKTLAREATSSSVCTQLLDPQDAASVAVNRVAGPRLQLNVSAADQQHSADEHGVALRGGAGFQPAMTRSQLSAAGRAAPLDHRSHGTVIITGAFLAAAAACVCFHLHVPVLASHTDQPRSCRKLCRLVNAASVFITSVAVC